MIQGPRTLGRIFKARIDKTPDRYAIGWIENNEVRNISFIEYKKNVEVLATAFHKIGLNVGDKVAILAQTCKEWHFLDMAVMCSRGCVVPIYPSYLGQDIDYIFKHSDSSILIVENDKQMEKVLPVMKDWVNLKVIISLTDLSEELLKKFRNVCSFYTYKELVRLGTEDLKLNPDLLDNFIQNQLPEEYASIIYTSGTTGEPKGAVVTQHALATMLLNLEKTVKGGFTQNDVSLVFLPLSHVLGRADSMLPLIFGWQSVYAESLEKLVDDIQIVKPTVMIAVPRIFEKIYAKIMAQVNEGNPIEKQAFKWATHIAEKYFQKIDSDLSPSATELLEFKIAQKLVFSKIYARFGGRIRYFVSGGAPLSPVIIQFLRYANLTILEGYGLTETVAPCCLNPLSKQVPGSVGRPIGDVQFSFGSDGEILIKSEALFKEYYKNPQATQEAIKDGWFHTGDIGEFTPEGYLKITDRKKDIIKTSGGKIIAPQKLENMAKSQPHISQMVVIGDQRKFLTALIGIEKERFLDILDELGLPSDCSLEDLADNDKVKEIIEKEIEVLNQDLAQFETIKKFRILPEEFTVDNFLTPSLKIKRKVVSAHYSVIIEAMYQ
ncbi:MAG: long-chain fatty acid--CoA ligase [Bdellovibrionales bacterium]|nr:long-chain fatty acid--CoA ligase [Bdellovibrionales bacterium]